MAFTRLMRTVSVPLLLFGFSSIALGYAVYGAIGQKYVALGRENGALGPAQSDEADAPYGGRFNRFQNGYIYWHPETGAFAVWGEIGRKWNEFSRVAYGYPITDESITPDNRGRYNHFRAVHLPGKPESSIYWTPQTGAHAIYGAIRDKWAALGWERSSLGYPTSDEVQDGLYRRTAFERGFIRWTGATGAETIMTSTAPAEGGGRFALSLVNGIKALADVPTGTGPITVYDRPTSLTPLELCARFLNRPGLNATLRSTLVSRISARLPSGFGIHSQTNHKLGSTCSARAELVNRSIHILVRVPNNRLFVRITTPSGFPGELDPNFVVTYDLTLRTSVTFPDSLAGNVVQGPITVTATSVSRPQSNSVTGGLLIAANDLISFLGGPDFLAAMRQGGVAQLSGMSTGVEEINAKLVEVRRFAPPATRLDAYPDADLVVLLATNRPLPPGPH